MTFLSYSLPFYQPEPFVWLAAEGDQGAERVQLESCSGHFRLGPGAPSPQALTTGTP
eukprot:COSAG02_NODE_1172_length_14106_cov_77.834725_4_plen_57_part_00